jgi:hypothetical protein
MIPSAPNQMMNNKTHCPAEQQVASRTDKDSDEQYHTVTCTLLNTIRVHTNYALPYKSSLASALALPLSCSLLSFVHPSLIGSWSPLVVSTSRSISISACDESSFIVGSFVLDLELLLLPRLLVLVSFLLFVLVLVWALP